MNHTQNFGLNKPLPDEFYDIEKQNENMDRIDEALKEVKDKAEDSTGAIPEFVQAETRENIKNGETTGRLFGKIARFFADLKPVAFSGSYSDLSNKPNIPSVPDSVKNPHPLSINGHSYDGSAAINAGTIGITYGGTGATTAEAARTNLGLGTAATQEIANNLTTTEAGYALDARQGKVLWDEVGEINSNLTDSGKITGYEVREGDGVYITYLDGADTVRKKLGSMSPNMYLWTSSPVDIKALMPDMYSRLTSADFLVGSEGSNGGISISQGYRARGTSIDGSCAKSYDANTGILSFGGYASSQYVGGNGSSNDCTVFCNSRGTVFAVYRGTIAGAAQ